MPKSKNRCIRCGAKHHSNWWNTICAEGLCHNCFREWEKVKPKFLKAWLAGAVPLEVFDR